MATDAQRLPRRPRWPWWALATGTLAVAGLAWTLAPAWNQAQPPLNLDRLLADVGIEPQLGARVPLDVRLRDETGADVLFGELAADRPVVLVLVYYRCPMLCGMVLDGLVRSAIGLSLTAGQDFTVVAVSFDPRETSELAAAARRTAVSRYGRGDSRGWRFLTGDEHEVRRLADAVGFRYRFDEATDQFAHAAGLVIVTSDGEVSRYLYGVEFPARDLRLALVEASQGRVGTATDRVLLLCYHYDPTTGRYGLAVMRALRLGGAATVLAMFLGIGLMLLHERRGAPRAAPVTASHMSENG